MTPVASLQEAREIVQEHGCPICGEQPAFHFYNDGAEISPSPCGHSVSPDDIHAMEHLDSKLLKNGDD